MSNINLNGVVDCGSPQTSGNPAGFPREVSSIQKAMSIEVKGKFALRVTR